MERKPWLANFGKGMLFGCEQPFLWGERCMTSQKTAAKETTFQLDIIFLCTLNNCGHAFKTNSFRQHETLWNGEKSLDKKQNKARRKSMNFIVIEGKISLKWQGLVVQSQLINCQKPKQLVLHLWMYQQSVRKNNGKQKKPALRHLPLGLFLFWRRTSLLFCFAHSWPQLKPCAPGMWLQHYRFPAKLRFAYCERQGFCYFIGSRLFKLTHSSVKAWYVYKSLEGENWYLFFERISFL